jgi:hypothetical protein
MFSGFILYHLQCTVLASFDAAPASGAAVFINVNDFTPVLTPAVQVA